MTDVAKTVHGFKRAEVIRELRKSLSMDGSEMMERTCYLVTELSLTASEVPRVVGLLIAEYVNHRINSNAFPVRRISACIERCDTGDDATRAADLCEAVVLTMMQPYKSKIDPVLPNVAVTMANHHPLKGARAEVVALIARIMPSDSRNIFESLVQSVLEKDAKAAAGTVMLLMQPDVVRCVQLTGDSHPWLDPVDGRPILAEAAVQHLWSIACELSSIRFASSRVCEYVSALFTVFKCSYRKALRCQRAILLVYAFAAICKDNVRNEPLDVGNIADSIHIILEDLEDLGKQATHVVAENKSTTKKAKSKALSTTTTKALSTTKKSKGLEGVDYLQYFTQRPACV